MAQRITPFRERLKQRKRYILFICTGNTCRSPMAAFYMRKLLDERSIRDIEIRSAGVMTITGLLASAEAIQVMDAEGVDLRRHRSTQLTPELIRKVDLILAMSPFHRQTALRMCEEAKNKTYLLKEFTKSDLKNVQIADPMGCTLEVFKKCFKEIRAAIDKLIEHEYIVGKPQLPKIPVIKKPDPKAAARKGAAKPAGKGAAVKGARPTSIKPAAAKSHKPGDAKPKAAAEKAKPPSKPAAKPTHAKAVTGNGNAEGTVAVAVKSASTEKRPALAAKAKAAGKQ